MCGSITALTCSVLKLLEFFSKLVCKFECLCLLQKKQIKYAGSLSGGPVSPFKSVFAGTVFMLKTSKSDPGNDKFDHIYTF